MADNVKDTKGGQAGAGPKTKDSEREKDPTPAQHQEGANMDLQNRRHSQSQDTTSSSGGANNPGQHGRDGGTINEIENNPAPTEDVISGERADDMQTEGGELQDMKADPDLPPKGGEKEVKKI